MRQRLTIFVAALGCFTACGGGATTPTTPTAPTTTPPAVVTPPVTTPPATPTITNFTGVWAGDYQITRCAGQGSLEDLFCSAGSGGRPGGIYPVGTRLPIDLELSQNGTTTTGLLELGQIRANVTGIVSASQRLSLQGSGGAGQYTMALSTWDTSIASGELSGTFTFTTRYQGLNGFATVEARLAGVRR